MGRHLSQRDLIDYEFRLGTETKLSRIREHLVQCESCQQRLEQLRERLSALELLGGEIRADEELIHRTVSAALEPRRTVRVGSVWGLWMGAAAAVLVVAGLIGVSHLRSSGQKTQMARMPQRQQSLSSPAPMLVAGDRTRTLDVAARTVSQVTAAAAEQIEQAEPFAPASAIELVTLPRRQWVQLTIYNSADLTLVRERRSLTLKRGWNWLQFMWANTLIDPTSLSLEPLDQRQSIEVTQLLFPARLREVGRWLIRSEVSGQVPFELTYLTSGLSWRAFYIGTLSADGKKMDLQGYVRVSNNSGEDYENAQTRLIVGQVHLLDQIAELAKRRYPHGRPEELPATDGKRRKSVMLGIKAAALADKLGMRSEEALLRKRIEKEALSEYFLYTIEGTETIADGWSKRLISLEANDVPVESLYKFDQERWGRRTMRFVRFVNDRAHRLGTVPIPDGQVRIYRRVNTAGHLSYVGRCGMKYVPVGEEVELNLGAARLVSVEPRLMEYRTEHYMFDPNGNISGWDEVRRWRLEVQNGRASEVEVEVTRDFGTSYWELELVDAGPTVRYAKHDARHGRFRARVGPEGRESFEYVVRTYHGAREAVFSKRQSRK